ncbi:tRNA lysidine(34) synthetase TilS [Tenacibaculum aquimarinum]|uniref:tRNA lysidine(34) synthetase TilS n=1 Tax=Tenacibaculum aquimarinum TaxID=2910675 RepID=UPI001F0A2933|nr:tRNA lysidine(34) synthetase TilS [Tenacibaculum aquimarinum]MCH3883340.1 tRNA lysidine(34) synthetase TilS [Tenacibaculum aquimarinum]
MLQKFKKHISDNFPFLEGKKLLIAISGGLDSVILTHLFSKLSVAKASLAHCNFQLRGNESDLDELFVVNLGEKLNLEVFKTTFNTKGYSEENKLSTQIAARELRYNWFAELVKNEGFDFVLTAHHADDNLETFLINLTRGTGLEGLTGIPAINKNIVRPLLVFSREEIKQFALENNINWREDASNAETKYVRNKIRHEIIPKLKELNTGLLASFEKTSLFLQESQQIIEDRIENIKDKVVSIDNSSALEVTKIDIEKIKQLSNPKAYLYQLLKEYNFTEWNDVENLLSAQSGKQVFSKTHRLLKNRDSFLVTKISSSEENEVFHIEENQSKTTNPINLIFEEVHKKVDTKNNVIFVDKDLLKFPLTVRKWQNGDYLYPSGMKGKKKLSKYFKDEKFSLLEKENTWLLCSADNEIIWVLNKRQDNRFLVTQKTKSILKITAY